MTMLGGRLAACARLGPACLGALLRLDGDASGGEDVAAQDTSRFALEILATGSVPFDLGAVHVSPGVGVGLGWLRRQPHDAAGRICRRRR